MKAIDYEAENTRRIDWLDITGGTSVTVLDYFAGKALQGVCSAPFKADQVAVIARISYALAEAMLAERNKRFTPQGTVTGVTGKTYG